MIVPFMPERRRFGRRRSTKLRAVVEAMFYIAATGCQWRQLPKDFPPYSTVQGYFYAWVLDGRWELINHALVMASREKAGRQASPTAGVIDYQTLGASRSYRGAGSLFDRDCSCQFLSLLPLHHRRIVVVSGVDPRWSPQHASRRRGPPCRTRGPDDPVARPNPG
jgi:transposase